MNNTLDSYVAANILPSWQRPRTTDEISDFISRRTASLGELDDDDFELAIV